jgi:WD40 repeat protein
MAATLTPRRINLESRQIVTAVDLCPEGRTVLVGQYASDGPPVLSTFDASTGTAQAVLDASRYRNVEAARFLGTSGIVAYVTGDPGVELANIASGRVEHVELSDGRPAALSVTGSVTRFAVGGTHVSVLEGSTVVANVPAPAPRPKGQPARVSISRDTKVAAVGVESGGVTILDGTSGAVVQRLTPGPAYARWAQFSPAGDRLVVIEGYANGAFGWDVASGTRWLPELLNERATNYWCGAFHPDGHHLYLGTLSGQMALIDVEGARIVWKERVCNGRIWDVAVRQDNLVFGGDDGAWITAIG